MRVPSLSRLPHSSYSAHHAVAPSCWWAPAAGRDGRSGTGGFFARRVHRVHLVFHLLHGQAARSSQRRLSSLTRSARISLSSRRASAPCRRESPTVHRQLTLWRFSLSIAEVIISLSSNLYNKYLKQEVAFYHLIHPQLQWYIINSIFFNSSHKTDKTLLSFCRKVRLLLQYGLPHFYPEAFHKTIPNITIIIFIDIYCKCAQFLTSPFGSFNRLINSGIVLYHW